MTNSGRVVLTGAGPGDPDLLTLKAFNAIQSSDWILYDRLVSNEIKAFFPDHSNSECVGKQAWRSGTTQSYICERMVELAHAGYTVCRLKGGDPFIFGRGGEELKALLEQNIEVEVIPAVTAGLASGASAGIPLTHRGLAQGVTFITGHGAESLKHNWQALRDLNHTLVFYMSIDQAAGIQRKLLGAGMPASTGVAIVERATLPAQRLVIGKLSALRNLITAHGIQSPATIIIGEVVDFSMSMSHSQQQEYLLNCAGSA